MMQGAIFDMDGVLVDNLDCHVRAFQQLGAEQGQTLSRDQISAVFGQKNRDMLGTLLGRDLTEEEVERLSHRKEEIYRRVAADEIVSMIVPGLRELLDSLRSDGIRMAVATSGPPENVEFVFDRLGIRDYFDGVITAREVERGKPDPDAFLKAAASIGVEPADTVVFEDSRSGIKAGLASGAKCVALATTHRAEELQDLNPHLICSDFRNLTPDDLWSLWEL